MPKKLEAGPVRSSRQVESRKSTVEATPAALRANASTRVSEAVRVTVDGEELLITALSTHGATRGQETAPEIGGLVEVSSPLRKAERLLAAVAEIQASEAAAQRPALLKAMMLAGIDPVPSHTVDQARRLARHRERLLASGAFTMIALQELRGDAKVSTTRTWLARRRSAGELFTVSYEGAALAPAFQFDGEGEVRTSVMAVLALLAPARLGSWATWSWFASTSAWLSGAVPVELLDSDTERVMRAASRFASNVA